MKVKCKYCPTLIKNNTKYGTCRKCSSKFRKLSDEDRVKLLIHKDKSVMENND